MGLTNEFRDKTKKNVTTKVFCWLFCCIRGTLCPFGGSVSRTATGCINFTGVPYYIHILCIYYKVDK